MPRPRRGNGARRATLLLVCLYAATVFSCKARDRSSARDTEGREFSMLCEERKDCTLEQVKGPKAKPGTSTVLRANGRLVGVCDANGDPSLVHVADCRPLQCERDVECPRVRGASSGACVGSWCVDPAHGIGPEDAVMLCLAGTGLGHDQPKQVERYALGLNCGEPCRVPSPCRQP